MDESTDAAPLLKIRAGKKRYTANSEKSTRPHKKKAAKQAQKKTRRTSLRHISGEAFNGLFPAGAGTDEN